MKKQTILSLILLLMTVACFQAEAQKEEKKEKKEKKAKAPSFYDVNTVQEIDIRFDQSNWEYVLDSLRVNGNGLMLADVSINGKMYKDAGVRYRGSQSFRIGGKRNALFIKLNYITKGRKHQKYKVLKLSNSLRDPSMLREVMACEIARAYMPAPRANYAKVTVNGRYYGLFVNVEAVADRFLKRNFKDKKGSFFKVDPNPDVKGCSAEGMGALEYNESTKCYLANFEMENDDGWDDLITLTEVLEKNPDQIHTVLNVDRTLWMLAFNNVIINLSSYSGQQSQNYYLYRDTITGLFTPIIWDLNLAFGSFKNTGLGSDLTLKEMQQMDPLLHADNPKKPLIRQLLKDPHYKKMYLSHIRTIRKEYFSSGKFAERAKQLQQMIRVPLSNDQDWPYEINDFNKSLTTTVGKQSKIPGLLELMEKRERFLKKHPALAVAPPEIVSVNLLSRKQMSNREVKDFRFQVQTARYAKTVTLYYRFSKKDPFQSINLYDDGQHKDEAAGDELYGITIEPPVGENKIEYYISASNPGAISYEPTRYMYDTHKAKLTELNE